MKGQLGWALLIIILVIVAIVIIVAPIGINYAYNNEIGNYFELSDKASTADAKLDYLVKYKQALVSHGLTTGQSTVFFPTQETSLEENFKVLLTLEQRRNSPAGFSGVP